VAGGGRSDALVSSTFLDVDLFFEEVSTPLGYCPVRTIGSLPSS
jgi:hypothetical protein